MTKCSVNECQFDAYKDESACILHCDKSDYGTDYNKPGFLHDFYNALATYSIDFIFSMDNASDKNIRAKDIHDDYLRKNEYTEREHVVDRIKSSLVVYTKIVFPCRDSRDPFDYLKILRKIGRIHFNYCEFSGFSLNINEAKCFYQDCIFYERWNIYKTEILENENNVLYQCCVFHKDVFIGSEENKWGDEKGSLFSDCEIAEKLEVHGINFDFPVFKDTNYKRYKLPRIIISNCIFNNKFSLTGYDIDYFSLDGCLFNSKFEFKESSVLDFKAFNTNFIKLVDTHETKYIKFNVLRCIYEDLVAFEKCEFGIKGQGDPEYLAVFMYTTFLGTVNFRNTDFYSGLDIEHINLKEYPNFLNAKINPENSNRETFRIIKNSHDKIGNHIEANSFFVQEMKKYRNELMNTPCLSRCQEKVIFFINEKVSNFGQSYFKPMFWLVIISFLHYLVIEGYEHGLLYDLYTPANKAIAYFSGILNKMASNILPLKKVLKDGVEFLSLIFYGIYASLIWQTIVAVKRHTKR